MLGLTFWRSNPKNNPCPRFLLGLRRKYPELCRRALKMLIPFPTTYCVGAVFLLWERYIQLHARSWIFAPSFDSVLQARLPIYQRLQRLCKRKGHMVLLYGTILVVVTKSSAFHRGTCPLAFSLAIQQTNSCLSIHSARRLIWLSFYEIPFLSKISIFGRPIFGRFLEFQKSLTTSFDQIYIFYST